jgi:tRNA-uridine 2-sulfurtransferase
MRLNPATKIVIGRTQADNEQIQKLYDKARDTILKVKAYPGPTVLLPGSAPQPVLFLAACICAGYSKATKEVSCAVQANSPDGIQSISVLPITPQEAKRFLII